ncbi:MAG: RNA polymerase sporulation sigma factor SigK [Clostridia bacterium]|nr:RNA polymerase sporulation sigma factor SigK [Clostridia bacterium]MBQ5598044.1 RNA polymerase sporulation sigma factor SigK [Clostridia bacterium]
MFTYFLAAALSNILYFILHVSNPGSFPRALSQKEEAELLERYRNGDDEARKLLIEHNLRLVAHVVKKYYDTNFDSDDLISIGTIGLIKAISSFNENKGTKLATYAARCIENEILMYFRAQKKTSLDVFINDPIDTDKEGNALTLLDVIASDFSMVDDIDTRLKIRKLREFLKTALNDRERKIIILRYGLCGKPPLPQREVAKRLQISRSYVSRIEKKALEKLYDKYEGK